MRRMLLVTAVLAVVAGAAAVWAVAQGNDGPPTVTGCLAANGDLRDFAVGSTPAKACKHRATQIQLSGGDITSVLAGTGLEGGAVGGAAALGISPAFRLPQDCANGDTPRWSDGHWACADGKSYVVFRRIQFVVTAIAPAPPQLVMTLRLPAGQYVVSTHVIAATVNEPGATSFTHLRCNTSPSAGAPSSGLVLTDLNIGNTTGTTGSGTLSGTAPMTVADGATVQLFCVNLGPPFGTLPSVYWAMITATPTGGIAPVQEDTTTG